MARYLHEQRRVVERLSFQEITTILGGKRDGEATRPKEGLLNGVSWARLDMITAHDGNRGMDGAMMTGGGKLCVLCLELRE